MYADASRVLCLKDGQYYSGRTYPEIRQDADLYRDILVTTETGSFRFDFTGILVCGNRPIVVFPKEFPIPEERQGQIEAARLLAEVILRYNSEPFSHSADTPVRGSRYDQLRVVTAIGILNRYVEQGLLHRNIERRGQFLSGTTLWPQTMAKVQPVTSHHTAVFDRPIRRIRRNDPENLVTAIHAFVVRQCGVLWGWMLNRTVMLPEESPVLPVPTKEAVLLLKRELRKTFYQDERRTISLLIAYLEGSSSSGRRQRRIVGTQNYEFIWEAICGYIFGNRYDRLRGLVPQPQWEGPEWNISQRPDVVSVAGDTLYVLDAKYRSAARDSIGWYDAAKQFLYAYTTGEMLKKEPYRRILAGVERVRNAFIFPGGDEPVSYVGKLYFPEVPSLGTVYAFTIGQAAAMDFYAHRKVSLEGNLYLDRIREIIAEDSTMC